jgi:hypothetical protein
VKKLINCPNFVSHAKPLKVCPLMMLREGHIRCTAHPYKREANKAFCVYDDYDFAIYIGTSSCYNKSETDIQEELRKMCIMNFNFEKVGQRIDLLKNKIEGWYYIDRKPFLTKEGLKKELKLNDEQLDKVLDGIQCQTVITSLGSSQVYSLFKTKECKLRKELV